MTILIVLLCSLAALAWCIAAHIRFRKRELQAWELHRRVLEQPASGEARYDPLMVAALPEVARRYFGHAIVPGTPLAGSVSLQMTGTFCSAAGMRFALQASQSLRPPRDFVWMARMWRGILRVEGSDAFVDGAGWTRFWLMGLLPLVDIADTPDFDRSATSRPAVESIWVPSSLLPQRGVQWRQTGADTAHVTLPTGPEPMSFDLTVDADGRVTRVETLRWSEANADKSYRLQPFWADSSADARFGGYSIPSQLEVGNGVGKDRAAFFHARIEDAAYGP